jgi:sugar-specific transcriptional regulator TrmB
MTEKEIKAITTKEIRKELKEYDIHDIIHNNLDEIVLESVSEHLNNKLYDGSNLEDLIIESSKKEIVVWIENNIEKDEMLQILKEAMVEKLKEFSFEQVKQIINEVVGK